MSSAVPLQNTAAKSPIVSKSPPAGLLLQRKCACGGSAALSLTGKCEACKKNRLQAKLSIGASNDPLEQEADRVADQVLAAPAHSTVSGATPSIQRFTGQSTGDAGTAPASVDRVLSGSGRPLDPALQQDMGQRFGHDFSRVRVHTGGDAEQSASDVNARAYTVGQNIVFGAGKFSPGSNDGRRLLAHELTHVVQQSGLVGIRTDQSNDKRGRASITPIARGIIQCDKGDGDKAKASPSWTVDELKKMLDTCDGGLGIWAKAKKANKDKDPKVTPGDKGATDSATGDITLDKTQDKCFAVQQLVQELSNLSRMADFEKILASATAGDFSRDEFIKAIEKIEYETGVKNVLTAFDACKDIWKCKTTPKEWARKAKDFEEYFNKLLSNIHKEHYGKWWDDNCKAAYDKKHAKK